MAKVIKGEISAPRRVQRYPWETWLDGQQWELKRGEDFDAADVEHFRVSVYRASSQRGLKVATRVIDSDTVRIQAFSK